MAGMFTENRIYREVIAVNSLTPRQRKVLTAFARQGFTESGSRKTRQSNLT